MKRVIGLMSGTSLDGVDAAMITTDGGETIAALAADSRAYTADERAILQAAVDAALKWNFQGPKPDFSSAERVLTRSHAEMVERLLEEVQLLREEVGLIGFHGQTVIHCAPSGGRPGATLQIGDGQALADATGVPVICDFRSADMEAGGQGAPLAPLYHQALAGQSELERPVAVLNLGGVANVTYLPAGGPPIAFDTGPANGLIDAWCDWTISKPFDENGALAASGRVDAERLEALMVHPYFAKAFPKSLDRWDFSLDPVRDLSPEDGAATLTAFTARSVAEALEAVGSVKRVLVTGGGRRNPVLMAMIAEQSGAAVEPVEAVDWDGDHMEAEAFAWLAARVEQGLPTSLPTTTGAGRPVSGGVRCEPR
jgi:anhydro-N-acetylmuramic acid kinase